MRRVQPTALLLALIAVLFAASVGERRPAFAAASTGTITTVAGGSVGDGGAATAATVGPEALATDTSGNVYILDSLNCRVRKVSGGNISTVVGNGVCEDLGDGGLATAASLYTPAGIAVDSSGNIYVSERFGCVVRKVTAASGIITTIAGANQSCSFSGDGGTATSAHLQYPSGLWVDAANALYIADTGNCRIRKVTTGTITTIAGTGACSYSGDNGPATSATLFNPVGVVADGSGSLYIADQDNCRIRKVAAGTITTFAGTGVCTFGGDGGPATSASLKPSDVKFDSGGNLYIADPINCRVRKVVSGTISTVAGDGACALAGDGGPATSASIRNSRGIALDASSNLYITDRFDCRVRGVASGTITTFAGSGSCNYGGDGGPATNATLYAPTAVLVDPAGNLFISDSSNCRIRKVVTAGTITTIAGNGACTFAGDGGSATAASLNFPAGIALDASGNLYIADASNCRLRKVTGGTITTVAGNGTCGFAGEGTSALTAQLDSPSGVAVDAGGAIYIADYNNCRIRKVSGGVITTFAGSATCAVGGDGGPAASAGLGPPLGVTLDGSGNVYITADEVCSIREVTAGTITTVVGNGFCGYGGDGSPASQAAISTRPGIAFDAAGNMYIADEGNCVVRRVSGGVISTIVGDSNCGYAGDGGSGAAARLSFPGAVAVDALRTLYIADTGNDRIRKVSGQDSDGDGCFDAKELGANHLLGGSRNPDYKYDFFDVPVPVLTASNTTGTLSHTVSLSDAIAVLFYVGTSVATPTQVNGNGVMYGSDLDGDGTFDGREYDRTIPDQAFPWRSGPPNDAVSIADAIVALAQVGANCN